MSTRPSNCAHVLYPRCGCLPEIAIGPRGAAAPRGRFETTPLGRYRLPADVVEQRPAGSAIPWVAERQEAARIQQEAMRHLATNLDSWLTSPEDLIRVMAALETSLARDHFATYCRQAWKVVEPATELDWNWHHELVCNLLQALYQCWVDAPETGDKRCPIRNALFNLPPGSLKSRIICVFFMTWCWIKEPGMKFICLSVNEDATLRDARAARDLIRSPWYQAAFHPTWSLKGDQDAISNYGNTEGGERLSRPSGSEIVGLRGDVILNDDPNNPIEAENKNEREKVNALWDTNQYNRVNDQRRSLRIGVQQRTNADDWTGHVLKLQGVWAPDNRSGWVVCALPAEFERGRAFVCPEPLREAITYVLPGMNLVLDDVRTVEGQSVHESRFSPEVLAEERKRWAGTNNYAGQMQQRPSSQGGGRIKTKYWNWFRLERGVRSDVDETTLARPRPADCHEGKAALVRAATHNPGYWEFDWVVLSVDCAAKKTERGSQWGMLIVGAIGAKRYILDDRTQRGDILEILEVMKELVRTWRPDRMLVEDKAAGDDLMTMLRNVMASGDLPMVIIEPTQPGAQGKEARLDACIPTIANGFVHLLDGAPWLEALVDECASFPYGSWDDRVDALTQVLNWRPEVEDLSGGLPEW